MRYPDDARGCPDPENDTRGCPDPENDTRGFPGPENDTRGFPDPENASRINGFQGFACRAGPDDPRLPAGLALLVSLLLPACPLPRPGPRAPAPPAPAAPAPRPSPETRAPETPGPGPLARSLGPPPYRLAVTANPPVTHDLRRLVASLKHNLRRAGAFEVTSSSAATLRVGSRAATLHVPTPEGRNAGTTFDLAPRQAERGRVLASDLHRFYTGLAGPYRTRIAFIAGTPAAPRARHVFTVSFDGADLSRVSDQHSLNLLPAWSRQGDLVYTAFVVGSPLVVLRPAGQSDVQLLGHGRGLNTGPAFSPDGQQIAVSQSVDGNTDIYLVDRHGVVLRRLTRHRGIDISPAFSPAARELAFVSDRGGSPQIYRMSLETGEVRRLTIRGSYNQEPSWCPLRGSRRIAYTHRHPGSRYEIHLLDADTGASTRLTRTGGKNTSPSWSPDCRFLVFASKGRGLWMVAPDGSQLHKLHAGRARSPAWSPPL